MRADGTVGRWVVTTSTAMREPTTTRRSNLATRRLVTTADPITAVLHRPHNAGCVTAVTTCQHFDSASHAQGR